MHELRKMSKVGADSEKQTKIKQEINKADSICSALKMEFIKEHTNSYEALLQLKNKKNKIAEDTLQKLYESLKPEFQKSSYGQVISTYLNVDKAKIGEPYINIKARTMKGDSFQLSEIQDKYIILDFWSPGCGFCRKANDFICLQAHGLPDFSGLSRLLVIQSAKRFSALRRWIRPYQARVWPLWLSQSVMMARAVMRSGTSPCCSLKSARRFRVTVCH